MGKNLGINDIALNKMVHLQDRAMKKITEINKGKAPFASVKISNEEKLNIVNSLGQEDMNQLISEFGREAVNQLIYEAKSYEMQKQAKLGGQNVNTQRY